MGAAAGHGDAKVEDALGLHPDVEVGGLAGYEKIAGVTLLYQKLGPAFAEMLTLLIGDYEKLHRNAATEVAEILQGVHHGRKRAFHIVDAAAVELAALLDGLELLLLRRDHIHMTVEQDTRLSASPYSDGEGGEIAVQTSAAVAERLKPPGLEPAADEVQSGLGRLRSVRTVANQMPGERINFREIIFQNPGPPPATRTARTGPIVTLRGKR